MNTRRAMLQYREIQVHGAVTGASPTRLIQLMYEQLLTQLAIARTSVERIGAARQLHDVVAKGEAVAKINAILGELLGCLNLDEGGDIAKNLFALYTYMMKRMTEANLHNDVEALDQVAALVREIKSGWDEVVTNAA